MVRILTLFLALLLSLSSFAQQEDEYDIKNNVKRSVLRIKRLKEGALLVRLFDKTKQIELLEKLGKSEATIQAYKDKVRDENLKIIEAYKSRYTFSPVFFFYAKDSEKVANRQFETVGFLNYQGIVDSNITMDYEYFLTSEISENRTVLRNLNGYHKDYTYQNIKDISQVGNSFEAVVIMDNFFIRLDAPFPYFVRTFSTLPIFKRTQKRAVAKLNNKIKSYYEKFNHVEIDPITLKVILKKTKE